MSSEARPLAQSEKVTIAILMTWAAGFIDVVGYLSLFGLYTANMSGNTVAMARHIALQQWWGFARGGWPVATFVFGLILGSFLFDAEKRRGVRPRFAATLVLEIVLIAIFIAFGAGDGFKADIPPQPATRFFAMVALLTIAMGLQNASIRRVGGMNVYTTFVTGSLVKFGESVSDFLFWMRDRTRHRFRRRISKVLRVARRQPTLQHAVLTFALWFAYLTGAIAGDFLTLRWMLLGLLAPLLMLIALVAYGAFRPLLIEASDEW
ncbi:MAG TPA: YoaK family protein [Candidatus Binataceae bacterium]|nr:YoaK family protein [Candidatus Binataceae bacterium]